MSIQGNDHQTGMSNALPNSPPNAPYDASQPVMPNGGVPPGYAPPQQTPYYQGQGPPPYTHQGMHPPYPNPYPPYQPPPPTTHGMPPVQAPPQWQTPPPNPAPHPNVSAPMHHGNYPPPPPAYGSQPGYPPPPPPAYHQPYGWPPAPMPGYYYPQTPAPMPSPHPYQPPSYGQSSTGAAPGHGYTQPSTISSYETSGTPSRDKAEQDSVLQSENSLPQQTQNMSLNVQTTQAPDPRQYQQPYPYQDPRQFQQPYQPQTPDQRFHQQTQPPDMGFHQHQPQNPDMTSNQQPFQIADPRLSQQTILAPHPIQSEQMTQVSDPRSSPTLTNPRTDEVSSVQATEGTVTGIGIVSEPPQGTFVASQSMDRSMMQEAQRSQNPPDNSEDDPELTDLVAFVQGILDKPTTDNKPKTKDEQMELVRRAFCILGVDKCNDALEEEFGMDTLFKAATGRTI